MRKVVKGDVVQILPPDIIVIHARCTDWIAFCDHEIQEVDVVMKDNRMISNRQRNAIHAMVYDIANYTDGCAYKDRVFDEVFREMGLQFVIDTTDKEEIRYALQQRYCYLKDIPLFSLSSKKENCLDMSTAHDFLGWLIDLCILHGIPCSGPLVERAVDIDRYLYSCIANRRCMISGRPGDIHHVTRVGAGRNRDTIIHKGMLVQCLAREYHREVDQIGQDTFNKKYHIHGIELDDFLCDKLGLKK